MWLKLSNIILRNRALILILLAAITVFLGYFAFTNVKLDNKFGNMLPKESPAQRDYLQLKKLFKTDDNILLIAADSKKLYKSKENFTLWKSLGDSIKGFEGVDSVFSEAHSYSLEKNNQEKVFYFSPIVTDSVLQDSSIAKIRALIRKNPFYEGLLYTTENEVSLMMVFIDEKHLENLNKANVVSDIVNLFEKKSEALGEIHYTGLPFIRVMVGDKVKGELYMFVALALLVTSLLLFIFFRSIKIVLICNVVVGISVIWSLGTIGLFNFKLSILMALIPPLMIVIGIPNCIYLLTKYHQEVHNHGNKIKGLTRVIKKIGNATFLTNLTTALGFSTFIFTNSERLSEFGIIASLNILLVFFLSINLLPIILSILNPPKGKYLKHLKKTWLKMSVSKLEFLVTKKRKWVYIFMVLIIGSSIFGMLQIEATGNITGDLPEDDEIVQDLKFIERSFGGSIPFDVLIDAGEKGRILDNNTLENIEKVQQIFIDKKVFSKSLSIADGAKLINMAFYGNDSSRYEFSKRRDLRYIKPYLNNANQNSGINPFMDSTETVTRISTQIRDIGSYEIDSVVKELEPRIYDIINPEAAQLDSIYKLIVSQKGEKKDSTLYQLYRDHGVIYNKLATRLSEGNDEERLKFDRNDTYMTYMSTFHDDPSFNQRLESVIESQKYGVTITGTSVIAAEGTQYLVKNLLTSLGIAIVIISFLMAFLFRSLKMVLVSIVPNFIPLLFTAGVMGILGITIKPSTILVFSIAFGISVDDTIHFLAKFRQELKNNSHDFRGCILVALRETGVSMIYTSIVLFFGFSVFAFSQFGGTKALGLLVSFTLLVAMLTNLLILPSFLMWFDKSITNKSMKKPYIDFYDEEEDLDMDELSVAKKIEPSDNDKETGSHHQEEDSSKS